MLHFTYQSSRQSCFRLSPTRLLVFGGALFSMGCAKIQYSVPNSVTANQTGDAIRFVKPALAVRGISCITCHGVIGSDVITDFGHGSPNFPTAHFAGDGSVAGRSSYNNQEFSWTNSQFKFTIRGTLHVPKVNFSLAESNALFGQPIGDFEAMLRAPSLGGAAESMVEGAGSPQIEVDSRITISYPSKNEIAQLGRFNAPVDARACAGPRCNSTAFSGLVLDSGGKFIRNDSSKSTVSCSGDVIVTGPLFLKNLNVDTGLAGCRIYATGTVFIQGPITYTDSKVGNLQITSSTAVVLGMSPLFMGSIQGTAPAGSTAVRTAVTTGNLRYPDGTVTFERFAVNLDSQYNPGLQPINGIPASQYFDQIMTDALSIGAEMLDASEQVDAQIAVQQPGGGATKGENGRLSVNYKGLLLNAPHVHNHYVGTFQGVIISDVAMLSRITSGETQFTYDRVFDNPIPILPALTTQPLIVEK